MSFYSVVNNINKSLWSTLVVLLLTGCTTINTRTSLAPAGSNGGISQPETSSPLASLKGGVVGQLDGMKLNVTEKQQALIAEYNALEKIDPNQPLAWNSTVNGATGQVIPFQPYRVGTQNCRAYTHTITKNGASMTGRGTACRNDDGAWEFLL